MIKLLIADDEHIERMALQRIIEEGLPDVKVVGLAPSGRIAVEQAELLEPDLILMDISMPGMDGLEALARIRGKRPGVTCIMVSAYDDFEYARQAIRLGVKDYLLKPTRPADIVQTVRAVVDALQEERREEGRREQERDRLERLLPIAEADFVTQLLFDHVHEVHVAEMLPCADQSVQYTVAVLTVVARQEDAGLGREEECACYRVLKQVIHMHAQARVGPMVARQIPVILLHPSGVSGGQSYRSQAALMLRKLLNRMHNHPHFALFVGIGTPVDELDNIRLSYHEALLASADLSLPAKHCFYEDLKHTSIDEASYLEVEKQVLEAVRCDNRDILRQQVLRIVDAYACGGRALLEAQQRLLDVLLIVWRLLQERGSDVDKPYFASQSATYAQLRAATSILLERLLASADEQRQAMQPEAFANLKSYIMDHAHKDLSLESIARHVQRSPYYVSKLFKEHFGMNYIDYLTACRIEKAKQLMLDKEKSLKAIAVEVGYHNPNYFSRVFKKICGNSPTAYRARLFGGS
ncbi:hypothetical protein XYCOK13_41540 [Xylanibacillus composti]|uniref:Uncharacterized protein n=1 Tax=Xylanibacillus composti TaxID=1572762 RepID=A0A8J4M4M0_9BACL|nr:response regulator [Xylanibacillus composti]GIQ71330.1 hypothetical protein XYCOK13_41540 [Xylanibacillus composti]